MDSKIITHRESDEELVDLPYTARSVTNYSENSSSSANSVPCSSQDMRDMERSQRFATANSQYHESESKMSEEELQVVRNFFNQNPILKNKLTKNNTKRRKELIKILINKLKQKYLGKSIYSL